MTVSPARILVVDDDALALEAVTRLLKSAGYEAFSAQSAEETLRLAEELRPDMILLDVVLPDLDGVEVCRRLKAAPKLADAFVVLFSGVRTSGEEQSQAMEEGADGYITRPISNRELLARIQAYLRIRAAEQKSRQKAREWQITFDAIADAMFLVDGEQRILRANRAAREIFGGSFQEIIGARCCETTCGKGREAPANCPLKRARETGERQTAELVLGDSVYQETSDALYDETGEFLGAVNILREITERKRAEKILQTRLRLSVLAGALPFDELLQKIADEAQELTGSQIAFFHFVEADQKTVLLQAWSANTLKYCSASGAARHYPAEEAGIWAEALKDKAPRIYNDYALAPNRKGTPEGHAPLKRLMVVPVIREDAVIALLGIGNKPGNYTERDAAAVSELLSDAWEIILRKRAEDALRRMNAELELRVQERSAEIEAVRRRLELAARIGGVGVWEMDVESRAISWDERMYQIYGCKPESFVPTLASWSALLHPQDEPIAAELRQNALRSGTRYEGEYRIFRADGELRYIATYGMPVCKADGRLTLLGVNIDVTHIKRAEQELMKHRDSLSAANAALEKAARLKDEFLASMSHELRTPLTGVLGFAEALQLDTYGELNERQRKAVKAIEDAGRHLLELINDVLDLSKIESGKMQLQPTFCSLADVCQASLQLVKGVAEQKKQKIYYAPPQSSISAYADARRLKQILVNLLSNAVKFTAPGGELGLEIQADEAAGLLRLSVWDRGIGIKTEDMQKLFQPFTQIDGSLKREYAGTGLGLSLVYKLTQMHNGAVEVESEFERGSRFTVILPWGKDGSLYPCRAESANAAESPARRGYPPPLALIADQDETLLKTTGEFLEGWGYAVVKARNGGDLLESAAKFHPALILADLSTPGMDETESVRRLRAVSAAPIFIFSAAVKPGDKERCLLAGASQFLVKPITPQKLKEALQTCMEKPQ